MKTIAQYGLDALPPTEQKILKTLQGQGKHFTAEGLAGRLRLHVTPIYTSIGRMKKRGLDIKEEVGDDGLRRFYIGEPGGQAETVQTAAPVQLDAQATNETNPWSALTEFETALINRMKTRGKINGSFSGKGRMKVAYLTDKNFTTALVKTPQGLYVGAAKRNPNDKVVEEIGYAVAFSRAIQGQPVTL